GVGGEGRFPRAFQPPHPRSLSPEYGGEGLVGQTLNCQLSMSLLLLALLALPVLGNDPLPLRRVLLPPYHLPQEMYRARQGVLMQMSQEEFEVRVARAARVVEAAKTPPRLVEARYRAALRESALVGTGQWTVQHAAGEPAVLPV